MGSVIHSFIHSWIVATAAYRVVGINTTNDTQSRKHCTDRGMF